ncbi:MAG: hypothetical protein ABW098_11065 [Candidatus Thiodiazotropha sp.]
MGGMPSVETVEGERRLIAESAFMAKNDRLMTLYGVVAKAVTVKELVC